jgi:hypothetical protein
MTSPTNALRSGTGLSVLVPGERQSSRFSVRVEERTAAESTSTEG